MTLGRRELLLGSAGSLLALGGAGVATDVLPGRPRALRLLHLDGDDGVVPETVPGRRLGGTLVSARRLGARCGWAAVLPPRTDLEHARDLPIVLGLHGRNSTHAGVLDPDGLGLASFAAAGIAEGLPPLVVAAVDGGNSYWHPRRTGEDAGAMVLEEFLPLLRERGLRGPVGWFGWSMGGYGALRLASLRAGAPDGPSAVAVLSAAIFSSFEAASPGSFDDAADLERMTVMGRQHLLDGVAVRVDCGAGDPFAPANQDYRAGFDTPPAGGLQLGDHDLGYWRRMVPAQLAFLADHLG